MGIINGTQFGRVGAFRFWCQKVLPAVYDDSLSYYELLCKVIHYLNQVIEITNTQSDAITELQELLAQFMAGEFDPYIEEKVDQWFEDNEPEIMATIEELQEQMIQMGIHNYSEPNFKCVDRFAWDIIGTDGVNSAQAGCVFEQDGNRYWAQILNSVDAGRDRLVIRNIDTNTTVSNTLGQWGHGYTMSYNPTRKELMIDDHEELANHQKGVIIINVADVTNPSVVITLYYDSEFECDNACWYDNDHFIGSIGNNHWGVFNLQKQQTDEYILDIDGLSNRHGYIFQSICWYPEDNTAYIGVSVPDGIAICDVDNENKIIKMKDFIACKQYYGFLYMREMEFAYRVGNKMYINQYDSIDGMLITALLEWDMYNGTVPNENSKYIQPNGNVGFAIDYANGSIMPDTSTVGHTYKYAGDAINELKSLGGYSRGFLIFYSNYPLVVEGKSAKLSIETAGDADHITFKGFHFANCDIVWNPSHTTYVRPGNEITATEQTWNVGIVCQASKLRFTTASHELPILTNPDSLSNPLRLYFETGEMWAIQTNKQFGSSDWFRWSVLNIIQDSNITDIISQNIVVNKIQS